MLDRAESDRRLQQSQRLESLGQLAGGVAHDFNNLLAVIVNYAAFVKHELTAAEAIDGPGRWAGAQADLVQIEIAAQRAGRLTHQLLAFARREVVRPRVIDLNEVIGNLEHLLRRTIGEHVDLVVSLTPGPWPVLADPGQMEQVLVNLAVNARDAMPGGGSLTIETENLTVDEAYAAVRPGLEPGRYVCVRVSDTGTGMPKEVRERAFEPFFTTKPNGEGSGLGLATVYGIVSQAGGAAQIYSEAGLGTTFTVLIPATDEAIVAPEAPSEELTPRSGDETVVVVEDEDAMREVTRRILTRNGYRVVTAADGPEAVKLVEEHAGPIDLLVTDVIMPRMLGNEIAERVRARRPGTRVLFMSGYAEPVLDSAGRLEPGVKLIQKPFGERALLSKVREVLDGGD